MDPSVFTGARIPYHVTSRQRLPGVTGDVLRGAAVNVPPGPMDQTGTWALRGHLCLTTEARRMLPPIMGGLSTEVGYDASVGSRAALLKAASMCPSRRELANSLHMGPGAGLIQAPGRDVHGRAAQRLRCDARQSVLGRRMIGDPCPR